MRISLARFAGTALVLTVGLGATALRAEDAAKLLPADTDVVVTFKLKEMLGKPMVQKFAIKQIKGMLEGNAELQKNLKALHLDPMTDLSTLTIGLGMEKSQQPTFTAIVDGKFDAAKMAELAKSEKEFKLSDVGGKTLYEMPGKNGGPNGFAAVLGDNRLVVSSVKASVVAILSGKAAGPPVALINLAGSADPKAVMTAVATKDLLSKIPTNPQAAQDPIYKIMKTIDTFVIELKVDKDIDLAVSFGTADASAAGKIVDFMAPNLDFVRERADEFKNVVPPDFSQFAPLLDVAKTLKIEGKDKKAILTATVKESVVEKIANKGD